MCVYLLHGADKILSWLADFASYSGGSPALAGRIGTVMATHLHCVTGFGLPTQQVVHDEVHSKHIETL